MHSFYARHAAGSPCREDYPALVSSAIACGCNTRSKVASTASTAHPVRPHNSASSRAPVSILVGVGMRGKSQYHNAIINPHGGALLPFHDGKLLTAKVVCGGPRIAVQKHIRSGHNIRVEALDGLNLWFDCCIWVDGLYLNDCPIVFISLIREKALRGYPSDQSPGRCTPAGRCGSSKRPS